MTPGPDSAGFVLENADASAHRTGGAVPRLRIVQVSTNDDTGGAARAAARLVEGLAGQGQDSSMYVLKKRSTSERVIGFQPSRGVLSRLRRRVREGRIHRQLHRYSDARVRGAGGFSIDEARYGTDPVRQLPDADVINLHWVTNFIGTGSFWARAPRGVPVFWTLHDMNPITGGCHYDGGCGRFARACGRCPLLGSDVDDDLSQEIWRRKNAIFRELAPERLHIVTPSRWLADEVRASSLIGDRFETRVIPNGLDTEVFAPRDRAASREELGLPRKARVVLFVAHHVAWGRKGFRYVLEALQRLSDVSDLHLMSLGEGEASPHPGVGHTHLGYVSDSRLLSMVYSAADVFVIPSLQDNLPNTVQEAMSCGTPVVGFDVGGIGDMVRPGLTGQLAPAEDGAALAESIRGLLEAPDRARHMGEEARRVALAEYTIEQQAKAYLEFYCDVLRRRPYARFEPRS